MHGITATRTSRAVRLAGAETAQPAGSISISLRSKRGHGLRHRLTGSDKVARARFRWRTPRWCGCWRTYRRGAMCRMLSRTQASGSQDPAVQEPSIGSEISLDPRGRLQRLQRSTPPHFETNPPNALLRGNECMARSHRRSLPRRG
jgi:hypothetical protein